MGKPIALLVGGWAFLWAALATYFTLRQIYNLARAPRLDREDSFPLPDPPPLVSVIIPARNEEERIARAVRSVLKQDYPRLELVVIDDASTDRTTEVALTAMEGDERARLVRLREEERNPGVAGKAFALARGEAEARGELLLLMDADVELDPSAVGVAVGYLNRLTKERPETALLSLAPRQICRSLTVELVQVGVYQLLDGLMDYRMNNSPRAREPVVSGAFLLVRREALSRVGGHLALKVPVLIDTELARQLRRRGFLIHFARGEELVGVEMYPTLTQALAGWRKNLWACLGWKTGRVLVRSGVVAFLWLSPLLLALLSIAEGGKGTLAYLGLLGWQVALDVALRLYRGHSPAPALLSPLGGALLVYLALAGLADHLLGRGSQWKGRRVGG